MPESISSANAAVSTFFLGHNGEWWDFWLIVAVIFAALSAGAIGIATAGSIVSHKRKALAAEVALEHFKLETEGKISDSNARAALAEKGAAEAALELAKFKSPRTLTEIQQTAITEGLKQFAGTRYDAGIGPAGDPEPLYLLRSIAASLAKANWVQVPWTGNPTMAYDEPPLLSIGLTMVTNVIVDVHPEYWKKLSPAAEALAAVLRSQGIDAIADSKPTTIDADVIHLRIGRKL